MKVVFFQPYLAMWRIQFLTRYIQESHHVVRVYDGGFGGENDEKSVSGNHAAFAFRRLFSWSPSFCVGGQSYPLYFSPFLIFNLIRDRPDVVVTEGEINFVNNISIFIYCFVFKKKYVWWSLGKVRTRSKNIVNKMLDPVVDFLLFRASCVMARNTWAMNYYVEVKSLPEGRVIVAPNSMDEKLARSEVDQDFVKRLREGVKGRIVLYVGALTANKRPLDLLDAFSKLVATAEYSDTNLWVVGDGPEKVALIEHAARLGLEDKVRFFGKVFEGVGNYFSAADMVVVPGLGGLVINHAMIFGKPVVSGLADGTELDLVVPGETGILWDGCDTADLCSAIAAVLRPENLSRMSINAKRKVDEFWNVQTMIRRVNECIEFQSGELPDV